MALTTELKTSLSNPNENPINAKGIAKMVCENFTRLK